MIRPPPNSTLFPSPPLFRSVVVETADPGLIRRARMGDGRERQEGDDQTNDHKPMENHDGVTVGRSEEHTSELQSRLHLVCRLLLEKKKKSKQRVSGAANILC